MKYVLRWTNKRGSFAYYSRAKTPNFHRPQEAPTISEWPSDRELTDNYCSTQRLSGSRTWGWELVELEKAIEDDILNLVLRKVE